MLKSSNFLGNGNKTLFQIAKILTCYAMGLSTFVQREDNSGKQCHWDRDSMIILLSAVSLTKENLMLLLQTWLID